VKIERNIREAKTGFMWVVHERVSCKKASETKSVPHRVHDMLPQKFTGVNVCAANGKTVRGNVIQCCTIRGQL